MAAPKDSLLPVLGAILAVGFGRALQEHLRRAAVEAAAVESVRCGQAVAACGSRGVLGEVESTLVQAGRALGKPGKATTEEIRRALRGRGEVGLAGVNSGSDENENESQCQFVGKGALDEQSESGNASFNEGKVFVATSDKGVVVDGAIPQAAAGAQGADRASGDAGAEAARGLVPLGAAARCSHAE